MSNELNSKQLSFPWYNEDNSRHTIEDWEKIFLRSKKGIRMNYKDFLESIGKIGISDGTRK